MKNYGDFRYIYDLENHIFIIKKNVKDLETNDIINNPNYVLCFKVNNDEDFKYNDINISFDNFPWKTYYKINPDLLSDNKLCNTKNNAWHHWIYHGKKEERAFSFINNTNDHRGRFGNIFFLNMCLHMFSQKYNLKSSYKYEKEFNQLGIYFHKGDNIYDKNLLLTDYNFENILKSDITSKNIIINNDVWFHTNHFCKIIKEYFKSNNLFKNIRNNNLYKFKYDNNNYLFIHVRLGDVSDKTICLEKYYMKTIESLQFNRGFISSDNIHHDLCKKLIKKYNLIAVNKTEVETIMFGSVCKHIILTGGTFSWLIGFLALKSSNIFYPDLKDRWYGDIFNFNNNWNEIKIS